VLTDLLKMKQHFDTVGYQAQTGWERMDWGVDELADIRARISTCIQAMNLFNTTVIK
jgi:hypothetical protein